MKELSPFRLTELPFELDDLSLSPSDVYQLMTPKHVTRPQFVDEDSGLGMDSFDVSIPTYHLHMLVAYIRFTKIFCKRNVPWPPF